MTNFFAVILFDMYMTRVKFPVGNTDKYLRPFKKITIMFNSNISLSVI